MLPIEAYKNTLFNSLTQEAFSAMAIDVFKFQALNNVVYKQFIKYLKVDIETINKVEDIPFLPISFFKSHTVVSNTNNAEAIFTSSGTTGSVLSKHLVTDLSVYEKSYNKGFELFYGNPADYCILALLPSYLERTGSSLIQMCQGLIEQSNHPQSGFYLNQYDELTTVINDLEAKGQKTLLIGVSFALLDLIEQQQFNLKHTIVMETGGMKGRREELTRNALHNSLRKGFGVKNIHSEYGMTELLSQAYSDGNGVFTTPPWMKVLMRDTTDPLTYVSNGKSGGINVIDLANINSCSFIATQDIGKILPNNTFEVLGRFDHSDVRGCNLMVL